MIEPNAASAPRDDLAGVASDLPLRTRAALSAGVDMWHTASAPEVGMRALKVSDGPAGARGARWFGSSSACAPCGSAMGATWSPSVARRVAAVLAAETRRKGADVLLAPTVNLHRHPLAGRNFECYSEDPELTAALATAFISGLQAEGVSACVKHFVANDQETDRHEISAEVSEVVLRELYLRPFEAAVCEAGTWSIMAAYNRVAGTHCSQHGWLLTDLLRGEWGFDGAVISDWWGTHSIDALAAGLDLEMPGPAIHLGDAVADAVDSGTFDAAALDLAASRMLRLAARVGALSGTPGQGPASGDGQPREHSEDRPEDRRVLREAAVQAIVLLRNDAVPGLDTAANSATGDAQTAAASLVPVPDVGRVALIGPNAQDTAIMGGGSASFVPHHAVGLLDALRRRLGHEVALTHERGTPPADDLRPLHRHHCRTTPDPDGPEGFVVEHFDAPVPGGEPLVTETSLTSQLLWMGLSAPSVPPQGTSVRLRTWFTPVESGPHTFGLVTGATGWLAVDGEVVLDNRETREAGTAFFGLGSAEIRAEVELAGGRPVEIEAVTTPLSGVPVGGLMVGHVAPTQGDPLGRAVAAAEQADVAVVVVGGNDQWETEGADRSSFQLPGGQAELVEAVVAANPRTVVVLNCGAPVDVSFAERAPALLQAWYPGQEAGEAICDVLLGQADPGGRLPTTFGRTLGDWESNAHFPGGDGRVEYAEGLRMGYRGFDAASTEPAFCFGHGLSTTTIEWSGPTLSAASLPAAVVGERAVAEGEPPVTATVTVANTGTRAGTEVVQCYLAAAGDLAAADRPPQHLAGFEKVHLAPGERREVQVGIGWPALRRWVPGTGWTVPTGTWEVRLSASSRDHRFTLELGVTG